MVGWGHWLNGHEFEQALGDGEGQGSLVCCSPWGPKELDTTERVNKRRKKAKQRLDIVSKRPSENHKSSQKNIREGELADSTPRTNSSPVSRWPCSLLPQGKHAPRSHSKLARYCGSKDGRGWTRPWKNPESGGGYCQNPSYSDDEMLEDGLQELR